METFLTFLSEHIFLAVLFLVTIMMLVVEELRPKGALEAADAAIMIQKGAMVVDLQKKTERESGLKNGQWVTDFQKFAWEKHRSKKFVLYCKTGKVSKDVVEDLRAKGFDAYFIAGGIESWRKDGFEVTPVGEK